MASNSDFRVILHVGIGAYNSAFYALRIIFLAYSSHASLLFLTKETKTHAISAIGQLRD
jgi:hypothetical protein